MPKLKPESVPSYRLHQQSGQARVTLSGKDILLGEFDSEESKTAYRQAVAGWLENGRRLPEKDRGRTVAILLNEFRIYAEGYYGGIGEAGELDNYRQVMRRLRLLYGDTPAIEFGPLKLKTLRDSLLRPRRGAVRKDGKTIEHPGWCRTYVNRQIGRVKMIFKWASSNELIPPSVHHGLMAVSGLRRGHTTAREPDPVKPVPEHILEATRPFLSRHIAAMVDLQYWSGMRPGEVCSMRTCDIDTTSDKWMYRPASHKTLHLGHTRNVPLGPNARAVLLPFLKTDLGAHAFSPIDAENERRAALTAARVTPLSCGNLPGTNRKSSPASAPKDFYTVASYRRAIARAAHRANEWAKGGLVVANTESIIPTWHPHQLRHNAGTRIRRLHGIEHARAVLGHRSTAVTEIYAERDAAMAQQVMEEMG